MKMAHTARHMFINGESFHVAGRDAVVLRQLADDRTISSQKFKILSTNAKDVMIDWASAGWLKRL